MCNKKLQKNCYHRHIKKYHDGRDHHHKANKQTKGNEIESNQILWNIIIQYVISLIVIFYCVFLIPFAF